MNEVYNLINAENERIRLLEERLWIKAKEEEQRANEERQREMEERAKVRGQDEQGMTKSMELAYLCIP